MPEHVVSALRNWVAMVEADGEKSRRQVDAAATDTGGDAAQGRVAYVDQQGRGLEYVPEIGFMRSEVPAVAVDSNLHFPVLDVLAPPGEPVVEGIFGFVAAPLAEAGQTAVLLEVFERCPSTSRAAWGPPG
jgi:hypothetical protein